MSGLYDGLYDDIAKKKEQSGAPPPPAPAAAAKPVPAHLLLARKRAAASAPPAAAAPAKKVAEHAPPAAAVPAAVPAPVAATILDPYDPAVPNVYEQLRGIRDDADVKRLRRPPPPTIGKELLRKAGGWTDGQRLGKRGQGAFVGALIVFNLTRFPRSGIARPIDGVRLANGQEKMESLMGSCVVLIRNVCGAGDVDEELKPDLLSECTAFGAVKDVVVWEALEEQLGQLAAPDHVRVFVDFEERDSAEKAKAALHGRFFGGRQLEVLFFSPDAFKAQRYAP